MSKTENETSTNNHTPPWTLIVVAIIGAVATIIAAWINSGNPPPPPPTQQNTPNDLTESQKQSNQLTFLEDDFNAGEDFNPKLWKKTENFGCDLKKKNGQAVFSSNNMSSSSAVVCTISAGDVPFEKVSSMEAELSTAGGAKGDYSIGAIEFSQGTFEPGTTTWIGQCGVKQVAKDNVVELFLIVDSNFPEGDAEFFQTVPASVEQSYDMRLEINHSAAELRCYADDKLVGKYKLKDIAILSKGMINRQLVGYWSAQSQAIFYADNVKISSPE
jgi:hypothetical protein